MAGQTIRYPQAELAGVLAAAGLTVREVGAYPIADRYLLAGSAVDIQNGCSTVPS